MARSIRIDGARFADTLHIAEHMREWDAREIYAQREPDPAALAHDAVSTHISLNVFVDDEPVANLGGHEVSPGIWQVHMFATDAFSYCALFTTRYVVRRLIPAAAGAGAVCAFCWSIEGHDEAQNWLKRLGARDVGDAPLGRAGERFIRYEWPADVFSKAAA
jgi:hypothetical protein